MKGSISLISFVLMIFSISTKTSTAVELADNTVVVTAENWCPFSCLVTDENKGLLVDVAEAVFLEVGLKVRYDFTTSWLRASQNVKSGSADILLSATGLHTKYLDLANEFFIYDETAFAVLKNKNIQLNKPEDLLNYSLGIIAEYEYDDDGVWGVIVDKHTNKISINVNKGEPHLLVLLKRTRIDIAVINRDVAKYYLDNTNDNSNIDIIRKNAKNKIYLGFNLTERGKVIRQKFKAGLKQLKASNKLKPIFDKYQVEIPDLPVID